MSRRLSIFVSGMIAADPRQGGAVWAVLQYVLGLMRLGHDVYLVEPIASQSLRPVGSPLELSDNAHYFNEVAAAFGLHGRSALLLAGTQQTLGLPYAELCRRAQRTEVLINISGMLRDEALKAPIPIRVYLDLDPAFNQMWSAIEGLDMRFDGHSHFVTVGQALGEPECPVPTCGLPWLKTRPPVVLDHWPAVDRPPKHGLTTVGNWRGYGSIDYQGVFYGQKAHSLRPLFTLPTLTNERFLLALGIHRQETKDLEQLAANRWQWVDPERVADTPAAYQEFIQGSKAEFGIAKSGYVLSHCGWFSDRSACYLASGRPVIAQETGFSRYLPTGEGLFAFANSEGVLAAIEALARDYPRHARRARAIAQEYFDSHTVLAGMLEKVGA